jgi:hypothetical protein
MDEWTLMLALENLSIAVLLFQPCGQALGVPSLILEFALPNALLTIVEVSNIDQFTATNAVVSLSCVDQAGSPKAHSFTSWSGTETRMMAVGSS